MLTLADKRIEEFDLQEEIKEIDYQITQLFQKYARLKTELRNKKIELLRLQKTLGGVYAR